MGVCRIAAACLGLLVAAAACGCDAEPARSPPRHRLPPQPRSMGDCTNRYDVGSPPFNACVVKVCIDRYSGLWDRDELLACVARVQDAGPD